MYLQNNPELFRLFLEHTPAAVAMFDREMRYIATSRRWLTDYGLGEQSLIGRCYYEVFPENPQRWKEVHQRCLAGAVESCEADSFVRVDGSIEWLKWESRPWYDSNDEIGGIIFSAEVITERKRTEEALRQSEVRFQKLAANVPGMIFQFLLRPDGSVFLPDTSAGCRKLLELQSEIIQQNVAIIEEMIHQSDRQSYYESMAASVDTLLPWLWEGRIITPSGKLKWVRAIPRPEKQVNGDILWTGLIIDISDRVQAEQELRQYQEQLEAKVEERTRELAAEIAERKLAEDALRQSETRFQSLAANIPGTIYQVVLRPDGTQYFSYLSPGCCKLYEVEPEEIKQDINRILDLIHADDRLGLEQSIIISAKTLQPLSVEYRILTPGDRLKWVHAVSRPEKQANGDIIWDGLMMDITDRKQACEEQQKFISLIENSSDFIAITTLEGQGLFVNQAGQKLVGLLFSEQVKQTLLSDYHTPEGWADFQQRIAPVVRKQGRWQGEFHFRHFQTGALIPVEYNLFTIKHLHTGQPIALGIITRDITERKQAEEVIHQSKARYRELAKREKLLNRLWEQIRHTLDLDKILETAVQEIQDLLQLDRCLFAWYKPEANPPIWEAIQEAKKSRLASILGCYPAAAIGEAINNSLVNQEIVRIDNVAKITDHSHRQLLQSLGYKSEIILPIQTNCGQIGVIACIHCAEFHCWTDAEVELLQAVVAQLAIAINQAELYTQSQQTALWAEKQAQQLQQTLQELQKTQTQLVQSEKMSSLGQLVAGIAHEINNPVNFIYGNIAYASGYTQDILGLLKLYHQAYPQPTPEILKEIDAIDLDFLVTDLPKLLSSMKVGAQRIREIVRSLRNFSRLDEAQKQAVDIHEGIESTLMILQNRLKAKPDQPNIEVIKNYGNLPPVECYAGQLNQVFMNLIANAIDALEESLVIGHWSLIKDKGERTKDRGQIRISTEVLDNQCVAIRIADNGFGNDTRSSATII